MFECISRLHKVPCQSMCLQMKLAQRCPPDVFTNPAGFVNLTPIFNLEGSLQLHPCGRSPVILHANTIIASVLPACVCSAAAPACIDHGHGLLACALVLRGCAVHSLHAQSQFFQTLTLTASHSCACYEYSLFKSLYSAQPRRASSARSVQ